MRIVPAQPYSEYLLSLLYRAQTRGAARSCGDGDDLMREISGRHHVLPLLPNRLARQEHILLRQLRLGRDEFNSLRNNSNRALSVSPSDSLRILSISPQWLPTTTSPAARLAPTWYVWIPEDCLLVCRKTSLCAAATWRQLLSLNNIDELSLTFSFLAYHGCSRQHLCRFFPRPQRW